MAKGERPQIEDFLADESPEEFGQGLTQDTSAADADIVSGADTSASRGRGDRAASGDDSDLDDLGDLDNANDGLGDDSDLDADVPSDSAGDRVLSLREAAAARGMQLPDDADDETVLESMLGQIQGYQSQQQQWAQQQQQWQQYYQQQEAQRYAAYQQQVQQQQWLAYQQQQAMQQAQQKQREFRGVLAFANKRPDYDPAWLQFIERDEAGNLVVKNGGDPQLIQKIAARRAWEEQAQRALMENPVEFVQEAIFQNPSVVQFINHAIHQATAPIVGQAQAQARAEYEYREQQNMAAARCLQETAGWIQDKEGKLTKAGQLYMQAVQEAAKHPQLQTAEAQHDWAMRYVAPYFEMVSQQTTSAGTPGESGAAKGNRTRIELLKKNATAGTGRGGSLQRTERKSSRKPGRMSLAQTITANLAAAGLA